MQQCDFLTALNDPPPFWLESLLELGGPICWWPAGQLAAVQIEASFWHFLDLSNPPRDPAADWLALLSDAQKEELSSVEKARQQLHLAYNSRPWLARPWKAELLHIELGEQSFQLLIHEKQAGNLLTRSQQLERLPQAAWQLSNTFELLYMNAYGRKLFNIDKYQDYGGVLEGIVHPEDAPMAAKNWEAAIADKEQTQMEQRLLLANGRYEWFRFFTRPVFNAQNEVVAWEGVSVNIHQEKIAHERIERSQQLLHRLTENIPGAVYLMKVDTQGKISFPFISKGILNMGIPTTAKQMLAGNFQGFVAVLPEDIPGIEQSIYESQKKLSDWQYEYRILTEDGQIRWHRGSSKPERLPDGSTVWYGIFQDTTEEREKTEALRKSQERLKKLTNRIPAAVFQLEQYADGSTKLLFISDGIERIHPSLDKALLYEDFRHGFQTIYPEDLPAVISSINQAFATGEDWDISYRVVYKETEIRWHRSRSVSEDMGEGRRQWYGFFQDITNQKEQEQELQRLLDITTDQNQRLRSFTHIVSHNIRSHAANATALSQLLDETPLNDTQKEYLGFLKQTAQDLDATIHHLNRILAIHQNTNKQNDFCQLWENIQTNLELLQPQIRALKAEVTVEIPKDLQLFTVPEYLQSIVSNLLENALRYHSPKRRCRIRVAAEKTNSYILLKVEDNGLGIDLEKQSTKLFQLYSTFHGNEDARGLGLFLIKNQVEALEGKIEVESTVDRGSIFTVYFPLGEKP